MSGPTPPGGPQYGEQPGEQPGYGQQPPAPPPGYPPPPQQGYPQPSGDWAPPPQGYQPPPQQGYQQQPPGYPQQQPPGTMGPLTTKFARIDPGPSEGFGVVAAVVTAVGVVLGIVSFTALNWFDSLFTSKSVTFSDVKSAVDRLADAAGPAKAYFGWLAWVLLIVTAVCAFIAAMPTVGRVFRILAPLLAVVAIGLSFLGLKLSTASQVKYSDYLNHAEVGFWVALAGFALMGVGGAIGARRQRS